MRINKFLCECGLCSRREADRWIEAGRVTVNGRTAEPGMQADENSCVEVDGRQVHLRREKTYLKFYKPVGVVCTFEQREKANLRNYLRGDARLSGRTTYAGRLDKNSEGLLILTDDGELIDEMMTARNAHEKEYEVAVNKDLTDAFLQKLAGGVYLEELQVMTRPCRVVQTGQRTFRITLTQGLNRQIRRMCRAAGYGVVSLKRVRILSLRLGDMRPGDLFPLTEQELRALRKSLERGRREENAE